MTIQITGLPGKPIHTGDNSQAEAIQNKKDSGPATAETANGADKVSLTASATRMQALEERINSLPVVDGQRVSETKQALATGSHAIDPDSSAENLLEMERALALSESGNK